MRPLAIFAVAFFFATSVVPAQWGGSFTYYGSGCRGTGGGTTCVSNSMDCKNDGGASLNTEQHAFTLKVRQPAVVTGATIRCSGAGTVRIELWKTDAAGKPTAQVGKSGTLTVLAKTGYGNHSGKFPTPMPLVPGDYALVLQKTAGKRVSLPECSGSACKTTCDSFPYWLRDTTLLPWKKAPSGGRLVTSIALNCPPGYGAAPLLFGSGPVPTVNKSFSVDLYKAATAAPCALFIGATKRNLDLTGLGAPYCTMLTSSDITLGLRSSATGTAKFKVAVPNNSYLANKSIYFQWVVIDKRANNLGIGMSRGGDAYIGP